jgi:hypothetical protein
MRTRLTTGVLYRGHSVQCSDYFIGQTPQQLDEPVDRYTESGQAAAALVEEPELCLHRSWDPAATSLEPAR